MLINYLKSKIKVACAFAVLLGIFSLITVLYDVPMDACLYAMLLSVFFGMVFLLYGFYRYEQRMSKLEDIKARMEFNDGDLPKTANYLEQEYQDILQRLYRKTAETISKNDGEITDMMDYYTLWAHQIKTPIAAMRLLLQSEEGSARRDDLLMELFKIEQYVEMVLQYLRLGSDSTDFLIQKYDLDSIVRGSVKKYSTNFIKKKVSLEYQPVECIVLSDEKWLSFVIEQVLSNALKYTHGGSVSIYMDAEKANTLVIEDTGMGIQGEDLPRVFEKGYTGYNGRIDKKSTGIGLYLCKMVMTKLGHTMSIESVVGEGTKVKLGLAYKTVRFE